ncbi:hypothetical protein BDV98DRAFT_377776 [Pterulicium gracile]|uniref:Uncharacterized protein n=1 Tax=Pterulicium gracile TaxID=1884261 RepID=A0A5C3Q0Q5_9AGAR|nr:hypothetical protein BDV98DRAFT_377776 [Pterula gracilis]
MNALRGSSWRSLSVSLKVYALCISSLRSDPTLLLKSIKSIIVSSQTQSWPHNLVWNQNAQHRTHSSLSQARNYLVTTAIRTGSILVTSRKHCSCLGVTVRCSLARLRSLSFATRAHHTPLYTGACNFTPDSYLENGI